jgi:glycosyltransferase involved in cell wall biosynthesis
MLIEAMPKLCEKHPDFELVIVGAGNDYDRLCAEAEKCNALLGRRAVILTGGRTDINNFIACADVFIGVSRAALEAMAMSKPTVLAGNEGYIGAFDESRLETGIQTNFCCRGCEESTPDKLYSDIAYILDKTPAEREKWGIITEASSLICIPQKKWRTTAKRRMPTFCPSTGAARLT